MKYIIKNATLVNEGKSFMASVVISGDTIEKIIPTQTVDSDSECVGYEVINAEGLLLLPGAIDDQVHFRDPGFLYKEDIETGAKAAAKGGFTTVVLMANTKPVVDNVETLTLKETLF